MKKILLATTLLAASTGYAAAEVTLSGDARMGVISGFGEDVAFTSRARVKFTLSGETDGGLAFGASFRADNAAASNTATFTPGTPGTPGTLGTLPTAGTPGTPASNGPDGVAGGGDDVAAVPGTPGTPGTLGTLGTPGTPGSLSTSRGGGAVNGDAGSVFISGAFGKLSMGDVDGAANAAVGHVSGVGLTGLGDLNESTFVGNGDGVTDPSALYEYSTGDLTIYASVTNPVDAAAADAYSVAAKYALGDYTVALGYESVDGAVDADHIILGASATFGAVTVKANYGQADVGGVEGDQMAISVDYKMDALTVTAFYADDSEAPFGGVEGYGLGASYDLGGGASVVGGYAKNETDDESSYDLGVSMSF